jgi:oxygen-independent coproporphyrinogen-3 oxidase
MLGIYIHIPFCLSKCPYCNFNSYPINPVPEKEYIESVIKEIENISEKIDKKVSSIYFGGGTPSIFSESSIYSIINTINKGFKMENSLEITLEMNPSTVIKEKSLNLYKIGINRINIGVQSFNDITLKNLGRIHSSKDAIKSYENIREAGFNNVGIDIMISPPFQSMGELSVDLNLLLSLKPEHISIYNLTIEKDTRFYNKISIDEDLQLNMFLSANDFLKTSGYNHYEISNYSIPGYESIHNINYWVRGEYIGFGAGAHSFLKDYKWGRRWKNISDPIKYIENINNYGKAVSDTEILSKREAIEERIFLGLRLIKGLKLEDFFIEFGIPLNFIFNKEIEELTGDGFILVDDEYIKLTERGLILSNEVFVKLSLS